MFPILTFVLLVAGVSSALTGQAGASRLLFAMGRDGVFPMACSGISIPAMEHRPAPSTLPLPLLSQAPC